MRTVAVALAAALAGTALAGDKSEISNGSRPLSAAQLRAVMPKLTDERAGKYLQPLNDALREFDISSPKRQAAFLAQIAHESVELKYLEELASGQAYEGRRDLGNTQPGDGKRYKGRGPLQLTGRANYRAAGQALKIDLETNPDWAARPDIAFRVAGWFWKSHGLNELADRGDILTITERINGGTNGLEKRQQYYRQAKQVLRVSEI